MTEWDNIDVAILNGEDDDSITLDTEYGEIETNNLYFEYTTEGVKVYFKDIDGDIDDKGRTQFNELYEFSTGDVIGPIVISVGDVETLYGDALLTGYTDIATGKLVITKITFGESFYYVYLDEEVLVVIAAENVEPVYDKAPIIGYTDKATGLLNVTKTGEVYTYEGLIEGTAEDVNHTNVAKLIVKDTEIDVGLALSAEKTVDLTLTNNGKLTKIALGVKGGDFEYLGVEEDDAEDAEAADIIVDGTPIGVKDYDVMDNYGTIIQDPENYAEDDRVVLSVPSEQIYATISVKGQGEVITTTTVDGNETTTTTTTVPTLGGIVVKDTEINNVKNKNLIIVGGSCINAEAARLLGGKACGEEFTLKTGITAGKALIQTFASPHDASKVAVVVAGFNAADTTKAVNAIINDATLDIGLGKKTII